MATRNSDGLVFAEHVRILYGQMLMAIIVNLVVSAATAAVLIRYLGWIVGPWFAATFLLSIWRWHLWRRYQYDRMSIRDAEDWARFSAIAAFLSGLIWGVGAIVLVPGHDPELPFLVIVVAGMSAGAVSLYSAHFPSLVAFLLPAGLPIAGALALQGTAMHWALAGMTVVFVIVMSIGGRNISNSLDAGLQYRFELESANKEAEARNRVLIDSAQDLSRARDLAEAANKMKTEFLANMSHELRTPLNAIIGFSELMTGEMFGPMGSPAYRGYAGDILASGRHLLQIINDILDISKIEAGTMLLNVEDVGMEELISACRRSVAPRAESAGLKLTAEIPEDFSIAADATFLKRMVLNLLTNAVKFTPAGGSVTVTCLQTVEQDSWKRGVDLKVTDTGIGMSEEQIEIALLPFRQVDGSLSRQHEGTGLGLPLARSLAELHGGKLEIESEPGVGTTVHVTLPAKPPADRAMAQLRH